MPKLGYPLFLNAPGVSVRKRRTGFVAYWQARSDLVKKGFRPPLIPLWSGEEPSSFDRDFVSQQCQDAQAAMLYWSSERRMRLPEVHESLFDGTVKGLIRCYVHDEDSPYRKLRYQSRKTYLQFLKHIEDHHGDKKIADLKGRDMRRWHEDWSPRGVAMSHSLMKHFRGLVTFGKTILDDEDCARLSSILSDLKFKMGSARTSVLTAEQATAIRSRAHELGLHSIALAQAIQFEGMLRQRDVIGEWVPIREPGVSGVTFRDLKWIHGLRWEEFDANYTLTHITSKRSKEIVIPLGSAPMFKEELARLATVPASGPVIICDTTGRPWSDERFRWQWRQIANDCGIPKNVRNQDSRAGAITEATEAGADLESIKHAATHSDIAMTQRYARGAAKKTAAVLELRVKHRSNREPG